MTRILQRDFSSRRKSFGFVISRQAEVDCRTIRPDQQNIEVYMMTLDQALDAASELPAEQRAMLTEILHKRQLDERRQDIAASARESIEAFRAGQLKAQPAEQVIAELRASLQAPLDE